MTPSCYFLVHLWLIPLLPLLSAALMFFLGRHLPKSAVSFFCTGSMALSFFYATGAVYQLLAVEPGQRFYQQILFEWINLGVMPTAGGFARFVADWGYLLDPLSSVMILLV